MKNLDNMLESCNPWDNYQFYDFKNEDEEQEFKEWFKKTAKHYPVNDHYHFSPQLLQKVIPSGCYGNGQYLSINNDIKYAEGIVCPYETHASGEYISHGFNIKNNNVVDYTYKKITKKSPHHLPKMPSEYWGVEIPKDFIVSSMKEKEQDTPYSFHRPLLLQYWRNEVKDK